MPFLLSIKAPQSGMEGPRWMLHIPWIYIMVEDHWALETWVLYNLLQANLSDICLGGRYDLYIWRKNKPIVFSRGDTIPTQFSSVAQSCQTLCNPMDCNMPGFPVHHQLPSLLKLMSMESVMPSNNLILCYPLLLLPSIFPSIRVFSNESALCIRW